MSGSKIIKGLEEAVAFVKAMSPEDYAAMIEAQSQSYARSLAPCEHGMVDFEQCSECRSTHHHANHRGGENG